MNRVVPTAELDGPTCSRSPKRIAQSSAYVSRSASARSTRKKARRASRRYALACGVMVENAQADDAREGMRAFLEKRKPAWRDA